MGDDSAQCMFCGERFKNLPNHITMKHQDIIDKNSKTKEKAGEPPKIGYPKPTSYIDQMIEEQKRVNELLMLQIQQQNMARILAGQQAAPPQVPNSESEPDFNKVRDVLEFVEEMKDNIREEGENDFADDADPMMPIYREALGMGKELLSQWINKKTGLQSPQRGVNNDRTIHNSSERVVSVLSETAGRAPEQEYADLCKAGQDREQNQRPTTKTKTSKKRSEQ